MTFDLASLGKPMTRFQLLKAGILIDCTQAAAWCGFRLPAAMQVEAWEECIGHYKTAGSTREDRASAGERLSNVWKMAAAALNQYKKKGSTMPAISFKCPSVDGKRSVRLMLTAGFDRGEPVITLSLEL